MPDPEAHTLPLSKELLLEEPACEEVDNLLSETLGLGETEDPFFLRSASSGLGSFVAKWAPFLNGVASAAAEGANHTRATLASVGVPAVTPVVVPSGDPETDHSDNDSDVAELRLGLPLLFPHAPSKLPHDQHFRIAFTLVGYLCSCARLCRVKKNPPCLFQRIAAMSTIRCSAKLLCSEEAEK